MFEPVCAADFFPVLTELATCIGRRGATCIPGTVATRNDGTPDCQVVERMFGDFGTFVDHSIPLCDVHQANFPCWKLSTNPVVCPSGAEFHVCRDPTCSPDLNSTDSENVSVSCSLAPPC